MTQRPPLFRQEALEFQTGQPQGGVLRIDPPWTGWAYWIVLAFVVAGVAIIWTARASQTTSGPALLNVQERTFVALVPSAASPEIRPGQLVRIQVDGTGGRPIDARALRAGVADQAAVRRAGFASSSQPAILVTGILAPNADVAPLPSSPRQEGRAVVVLRSQRILDLFLRQLRGTLGRGGGS
ncbi:MAG TPA: hypothetical protein VFA46_14405 [Actinomycetes bacterium]|jgi:hypothetical protein|nr:hypothetical protein [Actinomycetes bacterium]